MNNFRIVVPARYESSRLPGKVLLEIAGRPMIEHVWRLAVASEPAEVVVATDSEKVASVVESFGGAVCMTSSDCQSGTDRAAEVAATLQWPDDVPVINVQGDAPLLLPASIRRVADLLVQDPDADMATLCVRCKTEAEYRDPNVVKVVFDAGGRALYFSRSPIPARGHNSSEGPVSAFRHLGLYGYRVNALRRLQAAPPCELEVLEKLEQLRALHLGMRILIAEDEQALAPDVDTADDLREVEAIMQGRAQ